MKVAIYFSDVKLIDEKNKKKKREWDFCTEVIFEIQIMLRQKKVKEQ